MMWKQILEWFKGQFTLAQEVAQLRREVQESHRLQGENAREMERIVFALQREADHWRHEHENLLLRLENELLKFERRLPPRSAADEPKLKD